MKNQRGFSLVQTLVALGLSGGAALILMNIQKNASNIQTRLDVLSDVEQATRKIQHFLSSPKDCTDSLFDLSPDGTGSRVNKLIKTLPNSERIEIKINDVISPSTHLVILDMVLTKRLDERKAIVSDAIKVSFIKADKNESTGMLNLSRFKGMFGDKPIIRYIDVFGIRDASRNNKFIRCFSSSSSSFSDRVYRKACESLDGRYTSGQLPASCVLDYLPKCILVSPDPNGTGGECGTVYVESPRRIKTINGDLIQCCREGQGVESKTFNQLHNIP